jgi:hypothetical protein
MMSMIDFPIERFNRYLDSHIFKVYLQPTHDEDYSIPTNVRVELTGVKNYISVGENLPHIQYTLYILPTNNESDSWLRALGQVYGKELDINTSSGYYPELRWIMNEKLSDFLRYLGVEKKVICTKIVNELVDEEIETKKPTFESLVREWFVKNPHKHTLKPNQKERVIQKIINQNG